MQTLMLQQLLSRGSTLHTKNYLASSGGLAANDVLKEPFRHADREEDDIHGKAHAEPTCK